MENSLIQKYNVPGPRYTSYPTVPYWDCIDFDAQSWEQVIKNSFIKNDNKGISLYIHLPFCESMCTFCGCHKRITKNHNMETPYIKALLKEWRLYCNILSEKPIITSIHLGGGTPTFFSSKNLEDLINGILSYAIKPINCDMSFEGHPNNTTREHLQKLFELGFRRVSFGVQDYSLRVQEAIKRIQPFHNVAKATLAAREIGFTSIGHDIIFGLPFQTLDDVIDTIEKTKSLRPDTIAFYSYAHVPWLKGNGQRGFAESDLPQDATKRTLYETGKKLLETNGYFEIGMDHFALPEDPLFKAMEQGLLHRNFMGYSTCDSTIMIGLGVSAISDSWDGFAQNTKNLDDYYQMLEWNKLPIIKGHLLTPEDLIIRKHILNLMCRFQTSWSGNDLYFEELPQVLEELREMKKDGLVNIKTDRLTVTDAGKPFIRNICMAFDLRMAKNQPEKRIFSLTV
ncbi:MAG: oxygen-independent coproporphyrinogen III oxidase [Flavobacterium sp.]|nr:oxygen-independent coproporphyrinogen III oxidase [Flavobacterium sp.]